MALAIFRDFEVEFRQLEKLLNARRQDLAKSPRVADSNVIFADVRKAKSLTAQTLATRQVAIIQEIDPAANTLRYAPCSLRVDQPVSSHLGILDVTSHQPGVITIAGDVAFEPGDALHQDTMIGDIHHVLSEFQAMWKPIWDKHRDTPAETWIPFRDAMQAVLPQEESEVTLPPFTLHEWQHAVSKKKIHTAAGPDGVSRADMANCPDWAAQQLVDAINCIERGDMEWPDSILKGHISAIEKVDGASTPSEYRPICVLSLIYRTWSSHRARQLLHWIDARAPAQLIGNRPGKSTADLWWHLALLTEESQNGEHSLSGLVTDVAKCFNNIPRPIVYMVARMGIPQSNGQLHRIS